MSWQGQIISKDFYDRSPVDVAQDLLGKFLVRKIGRKFLVGMISETEAYLPEGDEAAHAFKGKRVWNKSLYKEGGHAYVHCMRQYCLLDVVTQGPEIPGAVLIRALKPVQNLKSQTDGPAKLCRALKITKRHDGLDLTNAQSPIFLADATGQKEKGMFKIKRAKRVGISRSKDLLLRFFIS